MISPLVKRNHYGFFPITWDSHVINCYAEQSLSTRYGIMAYPSSFSISPETLSSPTDLFLPIAANFLLMILVLMENGSQESTHCICGILCPELNTEE
jgi:hypothetical protein